MDQLKRLFGEPAATIGVIEAILAFVLTLTSLDVNVQGEIMAAAIAVGGLWGAWATQTTLLGGLVGVVKAGAVLFATLHWSLGEVTQAGLISLVTVLVGFGYRTQTSPVAPAVPPVAGTH